MIIHCNDYDSLGDISQDIWQGFPQVAGKKVFIKPNLVVPATPGEEASCTRLEVVQIVIEKLKAEGCKDIVVGDCGFKDQWELTLSTTGYEMLPDMYGVKLIGLMVGENYHKFTLKRLENYMSLFGAKFSDYVLDCDMVINVPKLKVHKLALVTGAIKNCMGMMIQKGSMHPKGSAEILHKRLADLYFLARPMVGFNIMDGIIGSEYAEHCGISKQAGILISSRDMWEVDTLAACAMGIAPSTVLYLDYIRKILNQQFVEGPTIACFERPLRYR